MYPAYDAPTTTDTATLLQTRLRRAIKRNGPLTWSAARLAMWGGQYDRRDAGFHNLRLLEWIKAGAFVSVELPDGDSLIGNP